MLRIFDFLCCFIRFDKFLFQVIIYLVSYLTKIHTWRRVCCLYLFTFTRFACVNFLLLFQMLINIFLSKIPTLHPILFQMFEIIRIFLCLISEVDFIVTYFSLINKESFQMTILMIKDSAIEVIELLFYVFKCRLTFLPLELLKVLSVFPSVDKWYPHFEF